MNYLEYILESCLQSKDTNPIAIVQRILHHGEFPVAGQAHHPLITGSLLAAYANASDTSNKENLIREGVKRANSIPGGFCAGFGADAAAISLGIAVSVILNNNVKKETDSGRAKAHTLTGMGMLNIANNQGNRCCRRSTYSMLILGTNYFNQNMGCALETTPESEVKCTLKEQNPLCNGVYCKFYR
ncbi:MAG: DUF5714 domain-containing protein [Bacillota bacterium]